MNEKLTWKRWYRWTTKKIP